MNTMEDDKLISEIKLAMRDLPPNKCRPVLQQCLLEVRKLGAIDASEHVAEILKAIPLFAERSDQRQSAIDFFHEHYANLVGTAAVYADDLHQHDRRLYKTLAAYQSHRNQRIGDLLPKRNRPIRGGRPRSRTRSPESALSARH